MKKQLLYSSCFFISSGGYRGEEINGKRIFRRKDSFTFANEEYALFFKQIRYNIFRKLKKEQKDRHAQKTLVE